MASDEVETVRWARRAIRDTQKSFEQCGVWHIGGIAGYTRRRKSHARGGYTTSRLGIVFGDGVEADGLEFISGGVLRVAVADKTLRLITGVGHAKTPGPRKLRRVG